ncbi:MAG: zinc ribbon domain-containing protein [Elusimicrobiota bacterium]
MNKVREIGLKWRIKMALIKCPECGKEFSEFSNNCPNCGIPTGKIKLIVCPDCGAKNRDIANFCKRWGL